MSLLAGCLQLLVNHVSAGESRRDRALKPAAAGLLPVPRQLRYTWLPLCFPPFTAGLLSVSVVRQEGSCTVSAAFPVLRSVDTNAPHHVPISRN